jgi:hypothetical protein
MTYLDSPFEFEPPKFSCMSQIKKNVILILLKTTASEYPFSIFKLCTSVKVYDL